MGTKRFSWNEGGTLVETAIALAFVIPMIFGIIEFGIALYCTNAMELVIEEAGRYAMVNNTGATSCAGSLSTAVVTKANQVLATYPVMSASVSVPTCNGPTAATATLPAVPAMMQIQGTFIPLNLLVPIPTMTASIWVPLS